MAATFFGALLAAARSATEAILAHQQAIGRDPAFAEAWLNLAVLHETSGRVQEAVDAYGRALAARPDYSDALFDLATLVTRRECYAEALPHWERYLSAQPRPKKAVEALRLIYLCRSTSNARASL